MNQLLYDGNIPKKHYKETREPTSIWCLKLRINHDQATDLKNKN